MTPELKEYYENRFTTMTTKGWLDFIQDTQEIFDSYNKLSNISSPDELWFKKGQLDILQWVLSLKTASEQTYEELSNETDI